MATYLNKRTGLTFTTDCAVKGTDYEEVKANSKKEVVKEEKEEIKAETKKKAKK